MTIPYVSVVILGREFKFARIDWDDSLIEKLVAIEEAFWNQHVIPRVIPAPDGSKACDEVLEQYFHRTRKESAIPLIGFDEKLNRRAELLGQIAELEKEQKQIEQEVKLYMEDNELASSDHYRVSWTNVDTARLDIKRLKAEKPEIYQDFAKITSSRRLTIKAAS